MNSTPDIAIIGGGAAGIGAARRLAAAGRSTLIVEAAGRLGGRAHSVTVDGMPLDLGCGWLHSAERNPWVGIAETSGFTVDRAPWAWRHQWRERGFPKAEQRAAQAAFEAFERRLRAAETDRAADVLISGDCWNPYLEALSGYINGAQLAALSIADYLAYDDAASDENWRVREGYGALVAASVAGEVAICTAATRIVDEGTHVLVETGKGDVRAGAAIVTVSSDVLASVTIRFSPALDDHLHAASRLPLGLADKLFLAVEGPDDLDADSHMLGNPHRAETGSYYLRAFGRPMIECFYGGAGARHLEGAGEAAMTAFAIDELAALLGSEWRTRLRPIAASAWAHDPLVRGSYSHALPGHADARAILAAPPSERLIFAGEACSAQDFSTAHGAYATGVAAAERMIALHWPRG